MVLELEKFNEPMEITKKAIFETAKGVFRVTLPNRNEGMQKLSKPRKRLVAGYRQPLASEKEEILSYVAEHKK